MIDPSELILSASSIKRRVRCLTLEQRFARLRLKAKRTGTCLVFPSKKRPTIARGRAGTGSLLMARVAWEIANAQSIPRGLWVLHHCDNPKCIEPTHLYLGDRAQNTRDMVDRNRSGRRCHPESWTARSPWINKPTKLSWAAVDRIREDHANGWSCRDLAQIFKVHVATIERVVNLSIWRPEAHP